MNDVMIDLETLGLRPGCEIIEVGAVAFDPRGTEIDPVGLSVLTEFDLMKADPYVLAWWNNQPPEVRGKTLFALPRDPLRFALELLTQYLRAACFEAVWCYGVEFDFPIITAAYEQQGMSVPWHYKQARCARTLQALVPHLSTKRHPHSALEDCRTQANAVQQAFRYLGLVDTRSRVVIESPLNGDIAANQEYARRCMADCLKRGEAPFASHLLYAQDGILDDNIEEQRRLGIESGFAWGDAAKKTVVYTDRGISSGMEEGIKRATELGREIEYRSLPETAIGE